MLFLFHTDFTDFHGFLIIFFLSTSEKSVCYFCFTRISEIFTEFNYFIFFCVNQRNPCQFLFYMDFTDLHGFLIIFFLNKSEKSLRYFCFTRILLIFIDLYFFNFVLFLWFSVNPRNLCAIFVLHGFYRFSLIIFCLDSLNSVLIR